MLRQVLFTICCLVMQRAIWANNLVISNITMTNDSTITFNVSWDNSWRVSVAPGNMDAVWLFIKKRECASNQWSHVNLSATATNHSAAAPLEVYIDGKDGAVAKGVFVRRSSNGVGNITSAAVSLRMTGLVPGEYDFRVFGVEMVQVPQSPFYLGDGSSAGFFKEGATSNPFLVTSEGAITAGTGAGQLTAAATAPLSLPAAYPKGFGEIYCMKYEISQGQYVDFTNLLTADQATNRQIISTASRLNITGAWPVIVANAPHRAMGNLAWADLLAYLDWAALRPMTELEFEKICRGPATPVADEYAWGTTLIVDANTLVNDGTATEGASNAIPAGAGIANYNNSTVLGPIRCGFAAKAGTSRFEAAAAYYGVMEMSGNLNEMMVTSAAASGVSFVGDLGDGEITTTPTPGFADVVSWPTKQANIASTTAATARCLRGGSWVTGVTLLQTSGRSEAVSATAQRGTSIGGRGVR